jgi:hypothetical protein
MLHLVADEPRTPVAVRITRPYSTEQDFLSRELETLTRTSVSLLGAPQKPQGVVLRFELALASGEPLLRGEGRVVGFKAASAAMESALTLRFTRLDARSKALVDRAAAVREAKGRVPQVGGETPEGTPAVVRTAQGSSPGLASPPNAEPSSPTVEPAEQPAAAPAAPSVPPPPPSSSKTVIAQVRPFFERTAAVDKPEDEDATMAPESAPPTSPELSDAPFSPRAAAPTPAPSEPAPAAATPEAPRPTTRSGALAPPGPERDSLLERLRARARDLSPDRVAAILAKTAGGSPAERDTKKRRKRAAQ